MAIGLALSGGGLRATLFHLGVVSALREAGVLREVSRICSVSGGSILAAHLVLRWEDYVGDGFERRAREILEFCSFDLRNRIVRRYPNLAVRWLASKLVPFGLVASRNPTDLLQRYYRKLYGDATLEHLRVDGGARRPSLNLLATNLTTGELCSFGEGGYESRDARATEGGRRADVRIAAATPTLCMAVAASSAFPGFFSPLKLTARTLGKFDADLEPSEQHVTDGGVYDNLGVRFFLGSPDEIGRFDRILVSDASLEFKAAAGEPMGLLKTALRASDILSHRVHQLESSWMEQVSSQAPGGRFVPIRIRDVVPRSEDPHALHENTQEWLRWIRTDLDRFAGFEARCLVVHGATLARRALRSMGRESPSTPPWDPGPAAEIPPETSAQVALLSKSVGRRLRPFGLRDPVSWIHAAILLFLVSLAVEGGTIWERLRRPAEIRRLQAQAETTARKHMGVLSAEIHHRRNDAGTAVFSLARSSKDKQEIPWVSLMAVYGLLGNPALAGPNTQPIEALLKVLDGAFESRAYDRQKSCWSLHETISMLRPEPSLIGVSAIGQLLGHSGLQEGNRPVLEERHRRLWEGLEAFYRPGGVWLIVPDQDDQNRSHPYVAAKALTALTENGRGGWPWKTHADRRTVLRDTFQRLRKDLSSWTGAEGDAKVLSGKLVWDKKGASQWADGLLFEAFAALLRAEAAFPDDCKLEARELDEIARRVEDLRHVDGEDSEERFLLSGVGKAGVTKMEGKDVIVEPRVLQQTYFWLPWGVECTHRWLNRIQKEDPHSRAVLRVAETLDRLLSGPAAAVCRSLGDRHTDIASELCRALSNLHQKQD